MNIMRFKLRKRLGFDCDQFEQMIRLRVESAVFDFYHKLRSLHDTSQRNIDKISKAEFRMKKEKARAQKYNVDLKEKARAQKYNVDLTN